MTVYKRGRLYFLFVTIFCIVLLFSGCVTTETAVGTTDGAGGTAAPTREYTVSFVVDEVTMLRVKVAEGDNVWMPKKPERENYIFMGWCTDKEGKNEFDFSLPIYADTSLYASFILDAAGITNKITTGVIRGVVRVDVTSYNTLFGIKYDKYPVIGSGVIFEKEGGTCYLLTNCHVAVKIADRDKVEYTVTDYLGNKYSAELYSSFFGGDAIDPAYDLAILVFKGAHDSLQKIEFAQEDAGVGDDIISLGYPAGQANAVTFGEVLKYYTTRLENTEEYKSNVTFDVAKHSAVIDRGSSGGPLLDSSLRIIGINYAGEITDEEFGRGSAVPLSRVNEFLDKYFKLGGIAGVKPLG